MSASENDQANLEGVSQASDEMQLALDLLHAKIERLCDTAFESKQRALKALVALTRGYGAEATINLLEDRGAMSRAWYFGFLRGHMFAKSAREAATNALRELPQALREREVLMFKRDDLLRARRAILERIDRSRLESGRYVDEHSLNRSRT